MAPRPPARKQRRVVEDDDIEEGSSQPTASASAAKVKQERSGKGKSRRDASVEDEPEDEPKDEEEDGDALIHQEIVRLRFRVSRRVADCVWLNEQQDLVDNFTDQPIPAGALFVSDIDNMQLTSTFTQTRQSAFEDCRASGPRSPTNSPMSTLGIIVPPCSSRPRRTRLTLTVPCASSTFLRVVINLMCLW